MEKSRFEALLAKAKLLAAAVNEQKSVDAAEEIAAAMETHGVTHVDTSLLGITEESLQTDTGRDAATEIIGEVISSGSSQDILNTKPSESSSNKTPGVAREVTLNPNQQRAYDIAIYGGNLVLIGAAGTGKTTTTGKITKGLIESGKVGKIQNPTKWLQVGLPGIVIVAYTRKAVNNIRYAVAQELKPHTVTIHKLLEFKPEFYEIEDPANPGYFKKTMRFEPTRNFSNPLPAELTTVVHEESSMESVDLYHQLQEAMPHHHQEIFLGDIQQLPPIFGLAILGFKMMELEVVELTDVYRQALESPIIDLAWKILSGDKKNFDRKTENYKVFSPHLNKETTRIKVPALETLSRETDKGTVFFQPWQKKLTTDTALNTFVKQITTWEEAGSYDPKDDIILCPFNKAFGTIEINSGIADYLGRKRNATVYEVIAGFRKHYLAVGDRVLYDKEDAYIVEINKNGAYLGTTKPQPASTSLDRWGQQQAQLTKDEVTKDITDNEFDVDKFLESVTEDSSERVNAASHIVTIEFAMSEERLNLESAADINNLLGGYAITVHKSQGSEYRKVYLVLHHTHAMMVSRELLYTACTRAKDFLHVICEADTFYKGVQSQRITGNTLLEKAEFFKGREKDYKAKKKELETLKGR